MIKFQTQSSTFSNKVGKLLPCPYGTQCLAVAIICGVSVFFIFLLFAKLYVFLIHQYSFEEIQLATSYHLVLFSTDTQ